MGSRKTHDGVEKVYDAAELWVDRALRSDDSLFTPGTAIWSSRWLGELRERFLNQPDVPGTDFYDKLKRQLEGSPPEAYQLMAEVLFVHFLIIWRDGMRGDTKETRINQALEWSQHPVTIPAQLVAGLTPGIARIGQARSGGFPHYVGYIIEFVDQWKKQESSEIERRLDDPWAFKAFATQLELSGPLFLERQFAYLPQQEALLHLVFPDIFEGTVSIDHKKSMADARAFAHYISEPTEDVDRKIQQIRRGLEAELGRDFDFYDEGIWTNWNPSTPNLWDNFVERAKEYVNSGRLEKEEIGYKVEIARRAAAAREAVLAGDDDWRDLLKDTLKSIPGHPVAWTVADSFNKWCTGHSDDAFRSLQAIWTQDNSSVSDRIRTFCDLARESGVSRPGTLMTVASVLMMALGVEQYPPFKIRTFNKAYDLTGYGKPEKDADEAALYEFALGFLDRFIDEAEQRDLELGNRLRAQSVVWMIKDQSEPNNGNNIHSPSSLQALAKDLNLPVEFLETVKTLLEEKKQVIFQGPPGTGKTYVARKLAAYIAGSAERVTLVQFHPSYAYEDFVQGFRPTVAKEGQTAGFVLRDGPLLRAAKRAHREDESGVKHFLVIDEINRGNIAKVFGELYFLLEYRDEPVSLQYQEEESLPFPMPPNLYIIGTMNTADRSIALVDLALRRRFHFVEFSPSKYPVKGLLHRWLKEKLPDSNMEWVANLIDLANEKLNDRDAAIGPSHFMKDNLDEAAVRRIWEHSVIPYVAERLFGDDERIREFDLDRLLQRVASTAAHGNGEEASDADADPSAGADYASA